MTAPTTPSPLLHALSSLLSPLLHCLAPLLPCFPFPSSSPSPSPPPHDRDRDRERAPLLLHVPPSYKSLALLPPHASPRPILKSPTPVGARTPTTTTDEEDDDLDLEAEGEEGEEREGVRKSTIRFDSVPEIRWIERLERHRSLSKPPTSTTSKPPPTLWGENWFASFGGVGPTGRMRYDQMVC